MLRLQRCAAFFFTLETVFQITCQTLFVTKTASGTLVALSITKRVTGLGTSACVPLVHIAGVTPEAQQHTASALPDRRLTLEDLAEAWRALDSGADATSAVDLVALGNPHFALEDHARLAELCAGQRARPGVDVLPASATNLPYQGARS